MRNEPATFTASVATGKPPPEPESHSPTAQRAQVPAAPPANTTAKRVISVRPGAAGLRLPDDRHQDPAEEREPDEAHDPCAPAELVEQPPHEEPPDEPAAD